MHPDRTTSPHHPNSAPAMIMSRPITIAQLKASLEKPNFVEEEFNDLPHPVVTIDQYPSTTEHRNRYSNVLPSPRTRVLLQTESSSSYADYINANYIRGRKDVPYQYIATQAPLSHTVVDFWKMVWDNNCDVIVMATDWLERGIERCAKYFPFQGSERFGSMELTFLHQSLFQQYVSCTLLLTNLDAKQSRTLHHYRITCWPLKGLPSSTSLLTGFLRDIKMWESSGPAVVHCSAGVGRTGVIIAVDIGLQSLLSGDKRIDVMRTVSSMRQDRAGMVQTKEQYRFVHQAIYDVAQEFGL